jgi:hypothetical protein
MAWRLITLASPHAQGALTYNGLWPNIATL